MRVAEGNGEAARKGPREDEAATRNTIVVI